MASEPCQPERGWHTLPHANAIHCLCGMDHSTVTIRQTQYRELTARIAALEAEVKALREDAFTSNDLAILYRLIHQYTEEAFKELPKEHPSHETRTSLRARVVRHLIAARTANRAALAASGGEDS